MGRSERFAKPVTTSVPNAGFLRMEDSVWKKKLVQEVPSVGKHEVHYVNDAGYRLVLLEVAQKLSYKEETNEEGMMRCLEFSVVFKMVEKYVLTMRMDYYQLEVTSGAAFDAEMDRSVEAPMMDVESNEFSDAVRKYQKAMEQQFMKLSKKGEADRSVRSRELRKSSRSAVMGDGGEVP